MKYKFLGRDYLLPLLLMPVLQYAAFWAVSQWVLDDFGSKAPWFIGLPMIAALIGVLVMLEAIYDRLIFVPWAMLIGVIYSIVMPFFGTYADVGSAVWSGICAVILFFVLTTVVVWANKKVLHGFGWWLVFDKDYFYSPYLEQEEEAY